MYRKMYIRLFNAATDAIAHIEEQNFGIARELLMEAQRECEEIYSGRKIHKLVAL